MIVPLDYEWIITSNFEDGWEKGADCLPALFV
jgi:hypothetical protein